MSPSYFTNILARITGVFALIFVLSACAPVKVNIDDVHMVHSINVENLTEYFSALCTAQHPTYSPAQVDACSDAAVGMFLTKVGESL